MTEEELEELGDVDTLNSRFQKVKIGDEDDITTIKYLDKRKTKKKKWFLFFI